MTYALKSTRPPVSSLLNRKDTEPTENNFGPHERVKASYLYLAKLVLMPKLYGFNISELNSVLKREEIIANLKGIKKGDVEVDANTKNMLNSILAISQNLNSDSVRESKFLQHQVEEYAKLSSKSGESNLERVAIENTIASFSRK